MIQAATRRFSGALHLSAVCARGAPVDFDPGVSLLLFLCWIREEEPTKSSADHGHPGQPWTATPGQLL